MVSTATIAQVLEGIEFPVTRDEILEYAGEMDAPEDVLHTLEELPDDEFQSLAEVWDAVGEIE